MGTEEEKRFIVKNNAQTAQTNSSSDKKTELDYYYEFMVSALNAVPFFVTLFGSNPEFYDYLKESISKALNEINSTKTSNIQSQNNKFIKTSIFGLPSGGVVPGGGGFSSLFGGGSGLDWTKAFDKLLQGDYQGVWGELCDVFGWPPIVKVVGKYFIPRIQRAIQQIFNPEMIRRTYILDTMNDFGIKKQKYEYSPSAFKKLLDSEGYNREEESQGAYDVRGKEITDEIESFKKSNPEKFKHEYSYYDDPDVKERLEKNSSTKFKKLAQSRPKKLQQFQRTEETDKIYNNLKQLLPKWNAQTLKEDLVRVASRDDLTDDQKSQLMMQTIKPYIKSVEPLHNYLSKIKSGR